MRNNYKSETMNNVSLYVACYLSVFCGCFGQLRIGNVALHKKCTMESLYNPSDQPDKAVNNDTSGVYNDNNCIHTGSGHTDTWWEVDLGRSYPVYSITVWAREGFLRQMKKCVIKVDGQVCFSFPESDITSREININCSMGVINGSKIRVSKSSNTTAYIDYIIMICEFQVWSCTDLFWGAQCDRKCGNCSGDSVCDKVTGHCSCKPGFQTPLCDKECANGTYGDNCSSVCGRCMHPMVCDKVDGHCSQCEPGLKLPLCKEKCDNGTYGQNCSLNCGKCTNNQVCDKKDGTCPSCPPGLIPPLCRQECNAGTYGQDCKSDCDRGCNNTICHSVTGHCECVAGWQPPVCQHDIGHIDGTVVGLSVAVAVLIIIVIVLLIRDLRRSKNSRQHTTKSTEIEIRNSRPPSEQRTDNADGRENAYDRLDRQEIYENAKERSVYMDLTS